MRGLDGLLDVIYLSSYRLASGEGLEQGRLAPYVQHTLLMQSCITPFQPHTADAGEVHRCVDLGFLRLLGLSVNSKKHNCTTSSLAQPQSIILLTAFAALCLT